MAKSALTDSKAGQKKGIHTSSIQNAAVGANPMAVFLL